MKHQKRMICLLLSVVMVLGMLAGCGNNQSAANDPTHHTEPSQTQGTAEQTEFDTTLESIRVVVDGIVHNYDVQVADGAWYLSAQDAENAFGGTFTDEYVNMEAYAQSADIRYTQDKVLTAAYFSTWEPYAEAASVAGFENYAAELKLPLVKVEQETISGTEMAELLDCFVAHEAPGQLDAWKTYSANLRSSNAPLIRSDALASLFVAAWCVGGSYMEYDSENHSRQMRDAAFHKADDNRNWALFNDSGIPGEFDVGFGAKDHYGSASCIFNIGTVSPVDGAYPFAFNEQTASFRHDENATYLEAAIAILRVYSTNGMTVVSIDDPAAVTLSAVFSEELLAKAGAPSTVTAENHPQWTGFVMNGEKEFSLNPIPDQIAESANWGFNSVRLNLDYEQLFNADVTEVDLSQLQILDQIVAQAVKYNMHLNIIMTSLPGRWVATTNEFENIGDFDLHINPEKQEQAKRLYAVIAERYKGISNDYLSFTPEFEPMNKNRSSGETPPEYSFEDYDASLAVFLDVIFNKSPDRLIILEPVGLTPEEDAEAVYTSFTGEDNVMYSYNFGEMPFIYANMTTEHGRNIDDENRSFYLVNYPTYYYELDNCIADPEHTALRDMISEEFVDGVGSLRLDGCLPAGTVVDIYLSQTLGGELQFITDGKIIYAEQLGHHIYETSEDPSMFIHYMTSDKKVTVTLTEDTEILEIATPGGAVLWNAMDVWLPEEYATERWYYATPYDVREGLEEKEGLILKKESRVMIWPYDSDEHGDKVNQLTIHENLTYSTSTIKESASKETVEATLKAVSGFHPKSMVRYERAAFSGTSWNSMVAYYQDMFVELNANNLGWWSNDWYIMTTSMTETIAGVPETSYGQYTTFNLELLKLMQQYQNSERP